jgi:hypothetical protein
VGPTCRRLGETARASWAGTPRLGSAHAGAGRGRRKRAVRGEAGRDERWAENRKKMIFLFFFSFFLIFFKAKFQRIFKSKFELDQTTHHKI